MMSDSPSGLTRIPSLSLWLCRSSKVTRRIIDNLAILRLKTLKRRASEQPSCHALETKLTNKTLKYCLRKFGDWLLDDAKEICLFRARVAEGGNSATSCERGRQGPGGRAEPHRSDEAQTGCSRRACRYHEDRGSSLIHPGGQGPPRGGSADDA